MQCTDAAALLDLTIDWLRHFELPVVHKHVVQTVLRAAANRDADVLKQEAWCSLEEHIGHEMISCLIAFVQVRTTNLCFLLLCFNAPLPPSS